MAAKTRKNSKSEEEDWVYYDDSVQLSDFWQDLLDRGEDENPVNLWLKLFETPDSNFEKFKEFWRIVVPRLLSPTPGKTSLDQTWSEDKIKTVLLNSLEAYIAGGHGREEEMYQAITCDDTPPSLCGRVFKSGDPIFSCRECSQDSTCVMCSDCFKHSAHIKHRYRMYTSEGNGGYCDCGDVEAFTRYPLCSRHEEMNVTKATSAEILHKFPVDVRKRAKDVFFEVTKYCLYVLCHRKKFDELIVSKKERETWPDLSNKLLNNNYCLLLMNDDFHSFHEVISVLQSISNKFSQKDVVDITELVNKEGRATIVVGTYKECVSTRDKIEAKCRALTLEMTLKTKILPSYIMSHQNFSIRLLNWLTQLFAKCSGFRALFAGVFFCMDEDKLIELPNPKTQNITKKFFIGEKVMTSEPDFWKTVRGAWMKVIIEGIMKEYNSKLELARVFVENYVDIMTNYVADDQEADVTIVNLTVQFFTVKSIAHFLLEGTDVFSKLVDMFATRIIDHVKDFRPDDTPREEFQNGIDIGLSTLMVEEKAEYSRFEHILTDLMYLLRVPFESKDFNDQLRKNFTKGTESFIHLISYLQYANPHKRQTGSHVEYESSEWEYVGKIIASLASISHMIHKWCSKDKGLLVTVTNQVVKSILIDQGPLKPYHCQVGTRQQSYQITKKDVLSTPVSVNIPFQRFLSGLLTSFSGFSEDLAETLPARLMSLGDVYHIVDPVITAVATVATINAGMWRLNGTPAAGQAFLYDHFHLCPSLKRHDLILLQACCCTIDDPGRITMALFDRFLMTKWASKDTDDYITDDDNVHKQTSMVENFLQVILAIVIERHVHNIGKITEREELRHRIVQLLCSDEMTHSKVVDALEVTEEEVPVVDEVLKGVATLTSSRRDQSRKVYQVKREFLCQFNPFYYYYKRESASKALERQLEVKRKAKERLLCPPPELPALTPLFEGLTKVTNTLPVLKVMMAVITRASGNHKSVKVLSSKMIKQVCFLIIQGCQDDLNSNSSDFTKFVEDHEIVMKLKAMSNADHDDLKVEDVRELISFTVERCNDARELLLNISSTLHDKESSPIVSSKAEIEEAVARKRRAAAAENRRHKIMAQMSRMQNKFAKEYAQDLENVVMDSTPTPVSSGTSDSSTASFFGKLGKAVATGPKRSDPHLIDSTRIYTCILCQAEQALQSDGASDVLVFTAHVQTSAVMNNCKNSAVSKSKIKEDFLPLTVDCGPVVTSCGHAMHSKCFQNFVDNLYKKERNRIARQVMNYDVTKNEYLCPMCERLSNNALPLVPSVTTVTSISSGSSQSFYAWSESVKKLASAKLLEEVSKGGASASETTLPPVAKLLPKLSAAKSAQDGPINPFPKLLSPLSNSAVNMSSLFAVNLNSKVMDLSAPSEDYRCLQLSFQACALTLHMSQVGREHLPLLDGVAQRDVDALRSVVRNCALYPFTSKLIDLKRKESSAMMKHLKSNALYLLSLFLLDDQSKGFMHLDMLNALIALTISLPSLKSDGGSIALGKEDHFVVLLCFAIHILQILIGFQPLEEEEQNNLPESAYCDSQAMERLWKQVSAVTGQSNFNIPFNLAAQIKRKSMRFLRCTTLFFHFYTDIPLPRTSYEDMCQYLGVPSSLRDLTILLGMQNIIDKLLHSTKVQRVTGMDVPAKARRLIDLPHEYRTLIDRAAQFKCPNNVSGECQGPALCLICDTIVCSQSRCCESSINGQKCGGCTFHAWKCSASKGIFVRLRSCELILLTDFNRGLLIPAPYVDDYGENDEGLKRGNPLHLDTSAYEELNKCWTNNGIPEKIARAFDDEVVIISSRWNVM